jgi:hypothetical protein
MRFNKWNLPSRAPQEGAHKTAPLNIIRMGHNVEIAPTMTAGLLPNKYNCNQRELDVF